jgi:hypothetical protein
VRPSERPKHRVAGSHKLCSAATDTFIGNKIQRRGSNMVLANTYVGKFPKSIVSV